MINKKNRKKGRDGGEGAYDSKLREEVKSSVEMLDVLALNINRTSPFPKC